MFIHNKDLQFEVRVEKPDPRFATLLQEQFGGANGELKAAMQYFTQAFVLRGKNPPMYDLLKAATETCDWMPAVASNDGRDQIIHSVAVNPLFGGLQTSCR